MKLEIPFKKCFIFRNLSEFLTYYLIHFYCKSAFCTGHINLYSDCSRMATYKGNATNVTLHKSHCLEDLYNKRASIIVQCGLKVPEADFILMSQHFSSFYAM